MYIIASDRAADINAVRAVTATVSISVERNERPNILDKSGYVKTISEGIEIDTEVLVIRATDVNPSDSLNGQLVFEILDAAAARKFQIDSLTGNITTRVSLKGINPLNWSFNVLVSDKGIPSLNDTATVTINVQKIGGPKFEPAEFSLNFDENLETDNVITRLKANDPTPDGPLIYEIRGDGLAPEYFRLEMEGDTAVLKLNKSFLADNNKTPVYKIRVQAYRQKDPNIYAEALVFVYIKRNPTAPRFIHGNLVFNISENIAVNTAIGDLNATDPDKGSNGQIKYSIGDTELSPSYLREYFSINEFSGKLIVTSNLMEDPKTFTYTMTAVAEDKGVPAKFAYVKVTVNVLRNPNPPRFLTSPYRATVDENVDVGYNVVKVSAVDEDGDPVTYEIKDQKPQSLYFKIDPISGQITTNAVLYDDNVLSYTITVLARDNTAASRVSEVPVIVEILRNPNPPVFAQSTANISISEYSVIGYEIITLSATDADNPNSNSGILRYKFGTIEPSDANQFFSISPTVGEIKVAKSMIRTTPVPMVVTLQVLAYDLSVQKKTATAAVTVNIVRNQFAPVFRDGMSYEITVYERDQQGLVILNLPATDPDRNVPLNADTPNAEIEYSLMGDANSYARFFEIRQSGELIIRQQLYLPTIQNNFITVST